jgi:NtrC-family two-component system sensor histidine kinase KinB
MLANDPAINHGIGAGSLQTSRDAVDSLLRIDHEPGSGLDLATILRDALSTAISNVKADGGFILVLDEGGWPSHWFVLSGDKGGLAPLDHARALVERGIVSWVIRNHRAELIDDLSRDAHGLHLADQAIDTRQGAALCLPMLVFGRVVGALLLIHRKPGFFKPGHQDQLRNINDQAALLIENARLHETVRRQAGEIAASYEVALNVSADQPLDRLLDTVVAQAMDLLRCQGAGVFLWREDFAELELVAAYDPEIDLRGIRATPGEGLVGRVFETGDPLTLEEYIDRHDSATQAADSHLSSGLPATTATAVPLVWQGRVLGVLLASDRTAGRHFGYSDQHLLTLLANQAAAAIASVQLHEQTARRLQELAFFNQTIRDITVTLDLDEIFAILTRRVKDLLGIEACSIALLDRETNELVFRMAKGGGAETVMGERVPWGMGIVGAVAQRGKPITVPDVRQDERFYQEMDRKQADFVTQSILAVPMISRGQVVGVVEALNKLGGFDQEDERLLSALAGLAGSVVENANLVAARRELEQLRENLTHMIIHDMRTPVGTISNCLQMLNKLMVDGGSDQAVQLINIASRSTQRLLNMVDSLLDIGRLEAGQELTDLRPVSIKALIQSAVDRLALYAQRKRMHLNIEWPDALPVVLADGEMLERVMVNLIDNAIKFTPAGGAVHVSVEVETDLLCVRVRDSGPGILLEHQQRIFDKFARVRDPEGLGGVGLGLAFCRLAIEAHGGRIWVESSGEQGSTFIFTLPLGQLDGTR